MKLKYLYITVGMLFAGTFFLSALSIASRPSKKEQAADRVLASAAKKNSLCKSLCFKS